LRTVLFAACIVLVLLTVGSATVSRRGNQAREPNLPDHPELEEVRRRGLELASFREWGKSASVFEDGYRLSVALERPDYSARFLTYIANTRLLRFQYQAAISGYFQAKEMAESIGDRSLAAAILANISSVYLALGAVEESTDAIETALSVLPGQQRSEHLPRFLLQLAEARSASGDMGGAAAAFTGAFDEADRRGDIASLVLVLQLWGHDLWQRGEVERAEELLVEAFRLHRMNGLPVPDTIYRLLSALELRQGSAERAERLIELAFEVAKRRKAGSPLWALYLTRAAIRRERGEELEALADLAAARASVVHQRRHLLPADATLVGMAFASLQGVYDAYIAVSNQIYFESGRREYAEESFIAAEEIRAAALRRVIDTYAAVSERLPDRYWVALGELGEAEESHFRETTETASRSIRRLRRELMELEIAAGLEQPSVTTAGEALTLDSLQAALQPSEALLSFHIGGSSSYLWALTGDRLELHRLPGREQLAEKWTAFRRTILGAPGSPEAPAAELYEALFGGLSPEVESRRDWILLLDDSLFSIPMAALRAPDGRRLVEMHSLRTIPSAAFLLNADEEAWQGPFAAVTDPVYNAADARYKDDSRRPGLFGLGGAPSPRVQLARLAGSSREAVECAREFGSGGRKAILLDGSRASLSQLRSIFSETPGVLHFATHVVAGPDDPLAGYLALSLRPGGEMELMGASEISRLRLHPQLVVMSGCHSGRGDVLSGEGLIGLSRAWLQSGAANVTATLWPARDGSGELLRSLYRQLGGYGETGFSTPPHEALRLAQLEMLRAGDWRSRPEHWAAYFLMTRN